MDSLLIKGGVKLCGEVSVSGAKNACLPMFAAALLTDEKCILKNVPNLSDVRFMAQIIRELGAEVENPSEGVWEIHAKNISHIAPYELVRKMRASICLLALFFLFLFGIIGIIGFCAIRVPGIWFEVILIFCALLSILLQYKNHNNKLIAFICSVVIVGFITNIIPTHFTIY